MQSACVQTENWSCTGRQRPYGGGTGGICDVRIRARPPGAQPCVFLPAICTSWNTRAGGEPLQLGSWGLRSNCGAYMEPCILRQISVVAAAALREGRTQCVDHDGQPVPCCAWEPSGWAQAYMAITGVTLLWTVFLFSQVPSSTSACKAWCTGKVLVSCLHTRVHWFVGGLATQCTLAAVWHMQTISVECCPGADADLCHLGHSGAMVLQPCKCPLPQGYSPGDICSAFAVPVRWSHMLLFARPYDTSADDISLGCCFQGTTMRSVKYALGPQFGTLAFGAAVLTLVDLARSATDQVSRHGAPHRPGP